MKENKPTLVFVGLLIVAALIVIFYQSVPPERLAFWVLLAAFESWTILNNRKADTISEAIWELSVRPFVPWLFGALTVYAIITIHNLHTVEVGTWLAMQGHFFWQAHKNVENDPEKCFACDELITGAGFTTEIDDKLVSFHINCYNERLRVKKAKAIEPNKV